MLQIYKIIRFICILHILRSISAMEDCSQYVRQLSKHDEFLNGRRPTAQSLIFQNVTIQGFINAMRDKDSVEPGEKYQCGFTRWVIARSDKSASHPFSCLSLSLSLTLANQFPSSLKIEVCFLKTQLTSLMNDVTLSPKVCISDSILYKYQKRFGSPKFISKIINKHLTKNLTKLWTLIKCIFDLKT